MSAAGPAGSAGPARPGRLQRGAGPGPGGSEGSGEAAGPGHRFAPGAGESAEGGMIGQVPVPESRDAILPAGVGQKPLSRSPGDGSGAGAP